MHLVNKFISFIRMECVEYFILFGIRPEDIIVGSSYSFSYLKILRCRYSHVIFIQVCTFSIIKNQLVTKNASFLIIITF